jgi:hypothetical protein
VGGLACGEEKMKFPFPFKSVEEEANEVCVGDLDVQLSFGTGNKSTVDIRPIVWISLERIYISRIFVREIKRNILVILDLGAAFLVDVVFPNIEEAQTYHGRRV